MNILITEEQYNKILEGNANAGINSKNYWSDEKKEKIKMDTIIKAMRYPSMQALKDADLLTHSRVRIFGLEDVCFPDRKKYRKRNEAINPEMVKYHAQFYKSKKDFYIAEPSLCAYAMKIGILDNLFPENYPTGDLDKRKQSTIDAKVHRAGAYKDAEQLKKDNPGLYKDMEDMGHFGDGLKYGDDF